MAFFLLAGMAVLVQSHMSLVVPGPARNAVDRKLPIFQQYPWYPFVRKNIYIYIKSCCRYLQRERARERERERARARVRTVLILCRLLLVKYMDHELTRKYTYDRLPVLLKGTELFEPKSSLGPAASLRMYSSRDR